MSAAVVVVAACQDVRLPILEVRTSTVSLRHVGTDAVVLIGSTFTSTWSQRSNNHTAHTMISNNMHRLAHSLQLQLSCFIVQLNTQQHHACTPNNGVVYRTRKQFERVSLLTSTSPVGLLAGVLSNLAMPVPSSSVYSNLG
jgi:hypothetical protein